MVNALVERATAQPAAGTPDPGQSITPAVFPDAVPSCEAFGQPVTELRALINGPGAALITSDGSFVFTRVYFCPGPKGSPFEGKPGFDLGDGHSRAVAGLKLLKASLDTIGLHLTFCSAPGLPVVNYLALVPLAQLTTSWKPL